MFIVLCITISLCNRREINKMHVNTMSINKIDSIRDWNFRNRDYIDNLISMIESSKNIESEYIGYTGERSKVYICYKELLEIASDSLWVKLSYSKSVAMRYYAYEALLMKESTNLSSVRNRLLKDTTQVCFHTYDIMICNCTLGELVENKKQYK